MKRSAPSDDATHPRKRARNSGSNSDKEETNFVEFGTLLETGSFSDVVVVVGTGEDTVEFNLHKVILAQNSGDFRRALKPNTFLESATNRIILPDHNAALVQYLVFWLYNGKTPKPANEKHNFSLPFLLRCIENAAYFDVPSLLEKSINDCIANLNRPRYQRYYDSGGKLEESFVGGMQVLFKLFPTQSKRLDPVIRAICENGWIPLIMRKQELRQSLQTVQELMSRVIEIQAGMADTEESDKQDDEDTIEGGGEEESEQ